MHKVWIAPVLGQQPDIEWYPHLQMQTSPRNIDPNAEIRMWEEKNSTKKMRKYETE